LFAESKSGYENGTDRTAPRAERMTRFSDDDRDRIRAELVEAGRDLFARHGFDRTRVRDVTEAVGIGTSTFYQFFDAKEDLYLAVLLVERDRIYADWTRRHRRRTRRGRRRKRSSARCSPRSGRAR